MPELGRQLHVGVVGHASAPGCLGLGAGLGGAGGLALHLRRAPVLGLATQGQGCLHQAHGSGYRHSDQQHEYRGGQRRHHGVAPAPARQPFRQPHPASQDRLAAQESSQILGEVVGGLVAAQSLLVDRLEHDRFQVARDLRLDQSRPGGFHFVDLPDQFQPIARIERRLQHQHLVQRQAKGVDIGADIALSVESFGGHVPQGPGDFARLGQAVVLGLGQAKVGYPHDTRTIEHQVRGLDVPVDDPAACA